MATPDRDTVYTNDGTNRSVYTRESNSTGWFVGIIVALALIAIAYLVFSANSQPSLTATTPAAVVTDTVPAPATVTPMVPADSGTTTVAPSATVVTPAPAAATVP